MPFHTIQVVLREISGPRISNHDRAQGWIPTVVFSQNYKQTNPNDHTSLVASATVSRKILLTTERKQIKAILKHIKLPFFFSTKFPLQIRAGFGSYTLIETKRVLPIKIHMDGDGNVVNLVFVWAKDGTELKVDLPIVYKGEYVCPGLKKGDSLNQIRTSLKYLCLTNQIPSKIEVDLSNLDIGDRVSIHDFGVHPSLKLLIKNETMPVCKIMAKKIKKH